MVQFVHDEQISSQEQKKSNYFLLLRCNLFKLIYLTCCVNLTVHIEINIVYLKLIFSCLSGITFFRCQEFLRII